MTGFIEDNLLRMEGLSDKDISDLNSVMPDIQALDVAFQAQWPRIARVIPIVTRIVNIVLQKQKELG
jgi:hypothetical protein